MSKLQEELARISYKMAKQAEGEATVAENVEGQLREQGIQLQRQPQLMLPASTPQPAIQANTVWDQTGSFVQNQSQSNSHNVMATSRADVNDESKLIRVKCKNLILGSIIHVDKQTHQEKVKSKDLAHVKYGRQVMDLENRLLENYPKMVPFYIN
uniref:Uncharacterized protein n=1 Tax=Romanomermis culicivorax TaxID=13658 RepID=A0A915KT34_ROMCU